MNYRGYNIVPKRDFGNQPFLIDGEMVKHGYVVTAASGEYRGCNVMPGATWFQTVEEAKEGIIALQNSKGNSDRFWRALQRQCGNCETPFRFVGQLEISVQAKQGSRKKLRTLYYCRHCLCTHVNEMYMMNEEVIVL